MSKPERRFAAWGPRGGAALLDALVLWGIVLGALLAAASVLLITGNSLAGPLAWLIALGTTGTYYVGSMTGNGERNGQTLGKQAVGIRVVRDDGKPLTVSTVLVREGVLKVL